jgi:hypothetical protein
MDAVDVLRPPVHLAGNAGVSHHLFERTA